VLDTLLLVGQITLYALGGLVVALTAIAPLTKTSKDDTVLSWAQWVELQLRKLLPAPSKPVARIEAEKFSDV
jgi:hypothetical protein